MKKFLFTGILFFIISICYAQSTDQSESENTVSKGSDSRELNSWEHPVKYTIGVNQNTAVINRALAENGEDFFLLAPGKSGRVLIETTGITDTYMELFDETDRDIVLDDNDDSGLYYNARIRYNVEAGRRYIVKVRGCEADESGNYGFRAYFSESKMLPIDEYEPNDEPSNATTLQINNAQEHTFHSGHDVDWFTFQITHDGKYIIQTKGIKNNYLDTCIELYDSNLNSIAEDDDGGNSLSSLIVINLSRGDYYLEVLCLEEEPEQGYTISLTSE